MLWTSDGIYRWEGQLSFVLCLGAHIVGHTRMLGKPHLKDDVRRSTVSPFPLVAPAGGVMDGSWIWSTPLDRRFFVGPIVR